MAPPHPLHVNVLSRMADAACSATLTFRGAGDGLENSTLAGPCFRVPKLAENRLRSKVPPELKIPGGVKDSCAYPRTRFFKRITDASSGHARAPTSPRKPCDIAPPKQKRARLLAQIEAQNSTSLGAKIEAQNNAQNWTS